MEDNQIIELYFNRDESALTETAKKYGTFCLCIALNILSVKEDAEECVNDTYHTAWNQIPPTKPDSFKAFLGRYQAFLESVRVIGITTAEGLKFYLNWYPEAGCVYSVSKMKYLIDRQISLDFV